MKHAVGYVLRPENEIVVLDLDHCRDPSTGEIKGWAWKIIRRFDSYTEVSVSGKGAHIWVRGVITGTTRPVVEGHRIEWYSRDRFMAVTTERVPNTPGEILPRQAVLNQLLQEADPVGREKNEERTPRPETVAIEDDQELLNRARAAGGGSGEEFVNLYDKGIAPEGKRSEADYRLMSKLFFWTGGDVERTIRLFEQSALYRPSPEKHAGYVRLSVEKLLAEYDGDYYDPPGRAREAHEAIERRLVLRRQWERWKGLAGQTDRAVYTASLVAGMEEDGYGTAKERGVEIKIAYRELAERAGISRRSVSNSLNRLEERELVERVPAVKGKKQGRILVLFAPPEDEKYFAPDKVSPQACPISPTQGVSTEEVSTEGEEDSLPCGARLWRYLGEGEVNLLRLRYGTADAAPLKRLGKGVTPLLEALLKDPTRAHPLHVLAEAVGRRKDSVKRSMPKLVHAGLAEALGTDSYRIHPDFETNFLQELEDTGIVESERLQREKHAREREAWRTLPEAPAAEPKPPREETEALYNTTFRKDNEHVRRRRKHETSREGFQEYIDLLLASPSEREDLVARKSAANKEADVVLLDEYRASRGDVTPGQAREALRTAAREAEKDDGLDEFFEDDDVGGTP